MFGVDGLRRNIALYETEWANTDDDVKAEALDRLSVDSIDEYVAILGDSDDEAAVEDIHYLWKDAMSVVGHIEHEWGLY